MASLGPGTGWQNAHPIAAMARSLNSLLLAACEDSCFASVALTLHGRWLRPFCVCFRKLSAKWNLLATQHLPHILPSEAESGRSAWWLRVYWMFIASLTEGRSYVRSNDGAPHAGHPSMTGLRQASLTRGQRLGSLPSPTSPLHAATTKP